MLAACRHRGAERPRPALETRLPAALPASCAYESTRRLPDEIAAAARRLSSPRFRGGLAGVAASHRAARTPAAPRPREAFLSVRREGARERLGVFRRRARGC